MADHRATKQQEDEVTEEEGEETVRHKVTTQNPTAPRNALAFWAYLTLATTILTFLITTLHSFHSLLPQNETTWFRSLPTSLRCHHSSGKLLKTHLSHHPIHLFAHDLHPHRHPNATLLLLHGLASSSFSFRHVSSSLSSFGLRLVSLDLPASGFSPPLPPQTLLARISEKGLFWAFNQLIENGFVEPEPLASRYGEAEVAAVIGAIVDELDIGDVHLVLHDSAVGPGARWVERNRWRVRSVSLIDTTVVPAFPYKVLEVPVVREVVLGFGPVFRGLLRLCCARGIEDEAADAYRMMMKGKGGQWGVVEYGKGLNGSFDLEEWAAKDGLRGLPLMVLWSYAWTDSWIEEGRRVARAIPDAKFVQHFGGRWPQEDAAEEIAARLAEFVLSLPNSHREVDQQPDDIKNRSNEANDGSRNHQDHGHGGEYGHTSSLRDAYGFDPAW